jgi:hypothetical protein
VAQAGFVFARACEMGLEGIVSKRVGSRYSKRKQPASRRYAGSLKSFWVIAWLACANARCDMKDQPSLFYSLPGGLWQITCDFVIPTQPTA